MTKENFHVIAIVFLLLFLTLPAARAQQDVAALAGEVTDTSGAQVADASVKILDTRTGSEQETKTENDGSYRFLRLQPGPGYTLTVIKDGFQTASITNLYLAVATTRTQNVRLDLGAGLSGDNGDIPHDFNNGRSGELGHGPSLRMD